MDVAYLTFEVLELVTRPHDVIQQIPNLGLNEVLF
jgi:hypothetical protein